MPEDYTLPVGHPAEKRERHVPEGCKVTAKLKRGTGTRDQDVINLKARGETAEDAAEEFEALLSHLSESGWSDRLRAVQPDEDGEE
jgi:hypothetical protein